MTSPHSAASGAAQETIHVTEVLETFGVLANNWPAHSKDAQLGPINTSGWWRRTLAVAIDSGMNIRRAAGPIRRAWVASGPS